MRVWLFASFLTLLLLSVAQAGQSAGADDSLEGLEFYLLPADLVVPAGKVMQFEARLQNNRADEVQRVGPFQLELDGVWYAEWPEDLPHGGTSSPTAFRTRAAYHLKGFALDATWRNKESGEALVLGPGAHTMRLAFSTTGVVGGDGQPARIATPPLQFHVLPPGKVVTGEEWFDLVFGWRPGKKYTPEAVAAKHREEHGQDLSRAELTAFYAAQAQAQMRGRVEPRPDAATRIETLERALAFPQDDLIRLRLYERLGNAYIGYRRDCREQCRRAAAEVWLMGLRSALELGLPDKMPEPPRYEGDILDAPPAGPAGYPTKAQRQMAAKADPERTQRLLRDRDGLLRSLGGAYGLLPEATEELRALALRHLGSREAADQVVAAVDACRARPFPPMPVIPFPRPKDAAPSGGDPDAARFMQIYRQHDVAIEAGFIPDETNIILGQPLFLTFTIINRSDKSCRFFVEGDDRSMTGRNYGFKITAVDADGQAVKDPCGGVMAGMGGNDAALDPEQTFILRLYAGRWCAFEKPGRHVVTCEYVLRDSSLLHGRLFDKDATEPTKPLAIEVKTSFELQVAAGTDEEMGQVIQELGDKAAHGNEQAMYEGVYGLSDIRDGRIAPQLAAFFARHATDRRCYTNRLRAVEGLSHLSSDAAGDALALALMDPDARINQAAWDGLCGMNQDGRVRAASLGRLFSELADSDPMVRRQGAQALGILKAPEAVGPLVKTLDDESPRVRETAAHSLGQLGDHAACEPLRRHLEDENTSARVAVFEALVELGEEFDVQWVMPLLPADAERQSVVRARAIDLLLKHAPADAARILVGQLEFDDPSFKSPHNQGLIGTLDRCQGKPTYSGRYHFRYGSEGTPEQIEENRKILAELAAWLKEQEAAQGPAGAGQAHTAPAP